MSKLVKLRILINHVENSIDEMELCDPRLNESISFLESLRSLYRAYAQFLRRNAATGF